MSEYFRPEIITIPEFIYGIFEINKANSFLTINKKGEYSLFTFEAHGTFKVETILEGFPPHGGVNIQTDPWNNITWQNEGRYVRVLEIDEKRRHGFSSVGDVNTVIFQIFYIYSGKRQIYIGLSFSTKIFESKSNYIIYDLEEKKIVYRSPRVKGDILPFGKNLFLFDSYEAKKWFLTDIYLENKQENELTKALSSVNMSIEFAGNPINLIKRFIIGNTYDPQKKLLFHTIRWDENYENVKIEPVIVQIPQNSLYDSGPVISADGNWVKVTAYYKNSPVDVSRLLLYHLDDRYPQGLSMPMIGGYTKAETYGAFVMHEEWARSMWSRTISSRISYLSINYTTG